MVVVKPHLKGAVHGQVYPEFVDCHAVGLDLAKRVFQVHAVEAKGEIVVARKLTRSQLILFFAELPPCVVAMEACSSAHHWGQALIARGHEVRLLPPAHVKPYVKRNKNDPVDAAAILRGEVPTRTHRFKFGTLTAHAGVSGRQPANRSGWSWSSIAHKRSDIEPASVKGRMP
jgi:hypothetical protein